MSMKYRRKPEVVEARQIAQDNIVEVANWGGGVVNWSGGVANWGGGVVEQFTGFIVFGNAVIAQVGQIVAKNEYGVIEVYGPVMFRSLFEPVRE